MVIKDNKIAMNDINNQLEDNGYYTILHNGEPLITDRMYGLKEEGPEEKFYFSKGYRGVLEMCDILVEQEVIKMLEDKISNSASFLIANKDIAYNKIRNNIKNKRPPFEGLTESEVDFYGKVDLKSLINGEAREYSEEELNALEYDYYNALDEIKKARLLYRALPKIKKNNENYLKVFLAAMDRVYKKLEDSEILLLDVKRGIDFEDNEKDDNYVQPFTKNEYGTWEGFKHSQGYLSFCNFSHNSPRMHIDPSNDILENKAKKLEDENGVSSAIDIIKKMYAREKVKVMFKGYQDKIDSGYVKRLDEGIYYNHLPALLYSRVYMQTFEEARKGRTNS